MKVKNKENRLEFLKKWRGNSEFYSFFPAFVKCLTEQDAYKFLELYQGSFHGRIYILRKIKKDIEQNLKPFHRFLVEKLIRGLSEPAPVRENCGQKLNFLYDALSKKLKRDVFYAFANSKYIGIRNRCYKIFKNEPAQENLKILMENWVRFHDFECAKVLVSDGPVDFLASQISSLEDTFRNWNRGYLGRLFVRVYPRSKKSLDRLFALDQITYCYVLAKLNLKISDRKALTIFEKNKYDDRLSLLIWSFGELKLWQVLKKISPRMEEIQLEKLRMKGYLK